MTTATSQPPDPSGAGPLVAVVDDHLLLVETVCAALTAAGVRAIAVPPNGRAALLTGLLAPRPDLVLLDLDLGPHGDATGLIAPLVAHGIRVLVVTGIPDRLRVARALAQGAIGYQAKSDGFDRLLESAHAALRAEGPLDPAGRRALLAELAAHRARDAAALEPFEALTEREQATLREMAAGRTVAQIARAWVISQSTVRSHVQAVLRKLDAESQLQAVAAARRSGWLDAAGDAPGPDRDEPEAAG